VLERGRTSEGPSEIARQNSELVVLLVRASGIDKTVTYPD
jgi:hypothetical protein